MLITILGDGEEGIQQFHIASLDKAIERGDLGLVHNLIEGDNALHEEQSEGFGSALDE